MAISNDMSSGTKIELRKINREEVVSDNDVTYSSKFLKWTDSDKLRIEVPHVDTDQQMIRCGEQFVLRFFPNNVLLECKGMVIESDETDQSVFVKIRMLSDLELFQRRQHFRLDYVGPLRYTSFCGDEIPSDVCWKEGMILDISGGGIRFNCMDEMEKGTQLAFLLSLPFMEHETDIILKGTVVLSRKIKQSDATYEQRVKFTDISLSQKEKLIRSIFSEERDRDAKKQQISGEESM